MKPQEEKKNILGISESTAALLCCDTTNVSHKQNLPSPISVDLSYDFPSSGRDVGNSFFLDHPFTNKPAILQKLKSLPHTH